MANCGGWNDPPTLTYQPTITSRTVLSRRPNHVPGFSSKSHENGPSSTLSLASGPPLAPLNEKQPTKATVPDTDTDTTKTVITGSDVIDESGSVIGDLECVFERQKSQLDKRLLDDVRRRLGILKGQWESGALSPSVKEQLRKLVAALEARDKRAAHDIHVALMVNHVTEVNQWMVGVKRLIATIQDDQSCAATTESLLPNGLGSGES